jgi:hypothetical protein
MNRAAQSGAADETSRYAPPRSCTYEASARSFGDGGNRRLFSRHATVMLTAMIKTVTIREDDFHL